MRACLRLRKRQCNQTQHALLLCCTGTCRVGGPLLSGLTLASDADKVVLSTTVAGAFLMADARRLGSTCGGTGQVSFKVARLGWAALV